MRSFTKFRPLFLLIALAGLLSMVMFAACDSDTPPPTKRDGRVAEGGTTDSSVTVDKGKADTSLWPDMKQTTPDVWPHSEGGYGSGSFGCKADSDCFGQKCCPTPWGVKLCAPSCM